MTETELLAPVDLDLDLEGHMATPLASVQCVSYYNQRPT